MIPSQVDDMIVHLRLVVV